MRKRVEKDRVPYDVWIREGLIEATDGNVIDYDVLRKRIQEDARAAFKSRRSPSIRWNATQLVTQLASDGLKMIPFGQGFASMAAPTRELEKLIVGRQIAHGGHPVLRWMMSNVAVKQDAAGNMKPDKAKINRTHRRRRRPGRWRVGRAVAAQDPAPRAYQVFFV